MSNPVEPLIIIKDLTLPIEINDGLGSHLCSIFWNSHTNKYEATAKGGYRISDRNLTLVLQDLLRKICFESLGYQHEAEKLWQIKSCLK